MVCSNCGQQTSMVNSVVGVLAAAMLRGESGSVPTEVHNENRLTPHTGILVILDCKGVKVM